MEAVLSDLKTQISDSSEDSDSSSPFDIFDDSRSTDSEIDDPDKDIVLDGNSYIGLISFPTLGQEFPVTRGWSYAAMNTAACQYSGRRVDNDLIICAHNYTGFLISWISSAQVTRSFSPMFTAENLTILSQTANC